LSYMINRVNGRSKGDGNGKYKERNGGNGRGIDIGDTWKRYIDSGREDIQSRNRLIENYLPIVTYYAGRLAAKLPDEIDRDDLVSAGIFGLMRALKAFDPDRKVKFETYCTSRISGSMLDELRGMDWVSRVTRSRGHQLERTSERLERRLGYAPSVTEMYKELRRRHSTIITSKIIKAGEPVKTVSYDAHTDGGENKDVLPKDLIEDKSGEGRTSKILKRDLRDFITKGLTRAERLTMVLYYYEEMTMKEIGQVFRLSESRVSQMHGSILRRLKKRLTERFGNYENLRRELVD